MPPKTIKNIKGISIIGTCDKLVKLEKIPITPSKPLKIPRKTNPITPTKKTYFYFVMLMPLLSPKIFQSNNIFHAQSNDMI